MKALIATAIYPSPERPALGTFVKTQVDSLRSIGVDAEPFVLDGRNRKLMYARAVPELRRRLRVGDVDVVHAHYSYVGVIARCQLSAPLVVTYHGDDLLGTIGANGKTTLASRGAMALGHALARVTDAVIVQNETMKQRLRAHRHVYVLPHEVDLELFRPIERTEARRLLGLDPERPYLLFAANPRIHVKRFPLAVAATEVLRERFPQVELLTVFNEPQPRLPLYLSAADALVFPSYQEGSPNVVKQAMACNLPIVATDVGDVADVIGSTPGCYVERPEAGAFATRLAEILAATARTQGRRAVEHFAPGIVAARLRDVYAETITRRSGRAGRTTLVGES
jgi:glycosyltransferase involved in cell wall biosynthesis